MILQMGLLDISKRYNKSIAPKEKWDNYFRIQGIVNTEFCQVKRQFLQIEVLKE